MPLVSTAFRVNSTTAEAQGAPAVTVLRDGRIVVAWTDDSNIGTPDIGRDVRARILNADGSGTAPDFTVNTESSIPANFENNWQFNPDVAALSNGGFAVAFTDTIPTTDTAFRSTTALQRFDATGTALGGNQLVFPSVDTNGNSVFPGTVSLTALNTGGVAFVGSTTSVATLPLDPGNTILLNTVTSTGTLGTLLPGAGQGEGDQIRPQITTLTNGRLAVAYLSNEDGPSHEYNLRVQIRTATGTPVGAEITVPNLNPFSNNNSAFSIAALDAGRFVVTWHQPVTFAQSQAGATVNILAQVYAANGTPVGSLINVHPVDSLSQTNPIVTGQRDGSFLVVWEEYAGSSAGNFLRARLFNADGSPNGAIFSLGVEQGAQSQVDITATNDGRYLVVWEDRSSQPGETDGWGIRAQYIDPRTEAVDWIGSTLGEQFVGTDFADSLDGAKGDDTVWGGLGDDTFFFFRVGAGRDTLYGGGGNDTFHVATGDSVFEATGEGSADRVIAYSSFALATGQEIEILQAASTSTISRMELRGNEFANQIIGNALSNRLIGLSGNDTIDGGGGSDTIIGGIGRDTLTGGAAADTFVLVPGSIHADRITDFTHDLDILSVSAAAFGSGLAAGALAPERFVANDTGIATTVDHRFVYERDTGRLFFDSDGSGAAARMLIATLTTLPTLDAGDFLLT
jgi:Ca2+-binding RTX toxin-like protein